MQKLALWGQRLNSEIVWTLPRSAELEQCRKLTSHTRNFKSCGVSRYSRIRASRAEIRKIERFVFLDRAVIHHRHENLAKVGVEFDTVRALFPEDKELYDGAGFWLQMHVQIAVRKVENIRGVLRIPSYELVANGIPQDIYSPTH